MAREALRSMRSEFTVRDLQGRCPHAGIDLIRRILRGERQVKRLEFRDDFYGHRTHDSVEGRTPDQDTRGPRPVPDLASYRWQPHCRGLYQTTFTARSPKTLPPRCPGRTRQAYTPGTVRCLSS